MVHRLLQKLALGLLTVEDLIKTSFLSTVEKCGAHNLL